MGAKRFNRHRAGVRVKFRLALALAYCLRESHVADPVLDCRFASCAISGCRPENTLHKARKRGSAFGSDRRDLDY